MNISQTYDHLFRYAEMVDIIKGYEKEFPDLVRLTSLAKTDEGRDIWMVDITNTKTGDYLDKPEYCIVGHFHATEINGMMTAMYIIDLLLHNPDDARVQDILDRYTITILPTGTPDGMEFAHNGNGSVRSKNRIEPPRKFPKGVYSKDIDGDGIARNMRIKNPDGPWKVDPEDPRLMIKREPYDIVGDFYDVLYEGYVNGDPEKDRYDIKDPYGVDLNRQWPYNWVSADKQPKAGRVPLQDIEARVVADLMLERKNMCAILVYHTYSGVMLYPPASVDLSEAPKEDIDRYIEMGKIISDHADFTYVPIHDLTAERGKAAISTYGSFDDFAYLGCGLMAYAIETWGWMKYIGAPYIWESSTTEPNSVYNKRQRDFMNFLDEVNPGAFKDWEEFDHPQLGKVEVGGIDILHNISSPPPSLLPGELKKVAEAQLLHFSLLPSIEIDAASAKKRDDGYYDVEVTVANHRFFPTYMTKRALELGWIDQDYVALESDNIKMISGAPKTNIGYLTGMSSRKAVGQNGSLWMRWYQYDAPNFKKTLKYIVAGEPGTEIDITAHSDKAGIAKTTIVLE